jgi:hypothetical protein
MTGSVIVLPPPTPDHVVCKEFYDGLSHGYWKNHTSDWDGYTSNQSFESIFGINSSWTAPGKNGAVYSSPTLLQALSIQGGNANAFIREATAALLNSSEDDTLVDGSSYFYSTTELINIVRSVYGLTDADTTNDHVYNATLGAKYQALFEHWNTIRDESGYTEGGYPANTGTGDCAKILNFDSGSGYTAANGWFIYNGFVIQGGAISEAGSEYVSSSGESVLVPDKAGDYAHSLLIAPGDWSNFHFEGAFFSSASDNNQVIVTAYNDANQMIGQKTFEVDASGPDGARYVDFSELAGFDDIHNLKIAGTASLSVDDFRYI